VPPRWRLRGINAATEPTRMCTPNAKVLFLPNLATAPRKKGMRSSGKALVPGPPKGRELKLEGVLPLHEGDRKILRGG
jgi:hypothetical protein